MLQTLSNTVPKWSEIRQSDQYNGRDRLLPKDLQDRMHWYAKNTDHDKPTSMPQWREYVKLQKGKVKSENIKRKVVYDYKQKSVR